MTDKMKQLITVLLAVLPAFLALSCSLEQELSPDGGQAGRTIRIVTADTDTRTVMGEESDGKIPVYWSEGDRISVNGVTSSPLEASSGSSSAEFKVRNKHCRRKDTVFQSHPVWMYRLIFTPSWRIK